MLWDNVKYVNMYSCPSCSMPYRKITKLEFSLSFVTPIKFINLFEYTYHFNQCSHS